MRKNRNNILCTQHGGGYYEDRMKWMNYLKCQLAWGANGSIKKAGHLAWC